jgi:Rieske Fe-S protein
MRNYCPHLGCEVDWEEAMNLSDSGPGLLHCHCHGSTFDRNGVQLFGPSPRSLDMLGLELFRNGIVVHMRVITPGDTDNPQRAIPWPS